MDAIQYESAAAGELVLAWVRPELAVLVTDATLAGRKSGLELAQFALQQSPRLKVVIVSGEDESSVPAGACFLRKSWQPLDLLRETMRESGEWKQ